MDTEHHHTKKHKTIASRGGSKSSKSRTKASKAKSKSSKSPRNRNPKRYPSESSLDSPKQEEEDTSDTQGVQTLDLEDIKEKIEQRKQQSAKQFRCSVSGCRESFETQRDLQAHKQSHNSEDTQTFQCDACYKIFSSVGSLRAHRKTHTRFSNLVCTEPGCGKSYATAEGLRLHVRNHHRISKPWVCTFEGCGRSFVRQTDLRLHLIRIHSDTRPFPCTVSGCSKSFACYSELKRHLTSHNRKKRRKKSVASVGGGDDSDHMLSFTPNRVSSGSIDSVTSLSSVLSTKSAPCVLGNVGTAMSGRPFQSAFRRDSSYLHTTTNEDFPDQWFRPPTYASAVSGVLDGTQPSSVTATSSKADPTSTSTLSPFSPQLLDNLLRSGGSLASSSEFEPIKEEQSDKPKECTGKGDSQKESKHVGNDKEVKEEMEAASAADEVTAALTLVTWHQQQEQSSGTQSEPVTPLLSHSLAAPFSLGTNHLSFIQQEQPVSAPVGSPVGFGFPSARTELKRSSVDGGGESDEGKESVSMEEVVKKKNREGEEQQAQVQII